MSAKPNVRNESRGVMHPCILKVRAAFRADRDAAVARFESAEAVLTSHTLWRHSDGRDLCDFDGAEWPCSTLGSIGFIYGVPVKGF